MADYLQRAARHIASKTDLEQSYAVGKAAVELAVKGMNAVMPTIVRKSSKPYRWKIGVAKLNDVANVEKKMPRDFITADGFHITAKCRNYLAAADRRRGTTRRSRTGCRIRAAEKRGRAEEDCAAHGQAVIGTSRIRAHYE